MFNLEVDADHCYRVGEQGILVHNASLHISYQTKPKVIAPCGGAMDVVIFYVKDEKIPEGVEPFYAVVQRVIFTHSIQKEGQAAPDVSAANDGYFELFDLAKNPQGFLISPPDTFRGHDKAGEKTKGEWTITGEARYFGCYDYATSGENWKQNQYQQAGVLFTLPLSSPPAAWSKSGGISVARVLKATWNCYQGTRQETVVEGGPKTS